MEALVGLELTTSFLAADMRMFGFGPPRPRGRGVTADLSLHLQCPWRIVSGEAIVVSSSDLYSYGGPGDAPDEWTYDDGLSLQNQRLEQLLGPRVPLGDGYCYRSGLVVTAASKSANGDLAIAFSTGPILQVFPVSTDDEQWRLFVPGGGAAHLVFGGE